MFRTMLATLIAFRAVSAPAWAQADPDMHAAISANPLAVTW